MIDGDCDMIFALPVFLVHQCVSNRPSAFLAGSDLTEYVLSVISDVATSAILKDLGRVLNILTIW